MTTEIQNKRLLLTCVCLSLAVLTVIAFWPLADCGFVNFDDDIYVYNNASVQSGLNWDSMQWAFSVASMKLTGNWHPLTWLSLMLDGQLFGLNPRGYHLVNLLFHILSTVLLFLVCWRMTGALWRSALVACLFAVHPLHVESVAWVSERKDVLSAFFWMLTMGAYLYYVERPGPWRYLGVLGLFVLGLMAKPMLVSLPFVLLLLDYWPLGRFHKTSLAQEIPKEVSRSVSSGKRKGESIKRSPAKSSVQTGKPADGTWQWSLVRSLLWEKAPLLALTAFSSVITYIAQQKGEVIKSFEEFPVYNRIANALVSYIVYIGKTVWPSHLAVFYPHPEFWSLWQVLGASCILITVTLTVVWLAKRFPYLAMGWFWYVGTLVPVIGIVQVGLQSRADRYTYIPLIGIFIIVTWGISELLNRLPQWRATIGYAMSILLIVFIIVTRNQLNYWQSGMTLWTYAIEVTNKNYIAHNNLGSILGKEGRMDEAYVQLIEAIQIKPGFAEAYNNIGNILRYKKKEDEAIKYYTEALRIEPNYAEAHNNLGSILISKGDLIDAEKHLKFALQIKPDYANANFNLAHVLFLQNNLEEANEYLCYALKFKPDMFEAHYYLGKIASAQGKYDKAIMHYQDTLRLRPDFESAKNDLNSILKSRGITP